MKKKEIRVNDLRARDDPLVTALINEKDVSKGTIEGKLPELRENFGIPKAKKENGRGGWFLKNPWSRVVDFKRSDNAEPVLYLALQSVSVHGTAKAVAKQIRNIRKTTHGIDEALTLVVAWREAGENAYGNSSEKKDSYYVGGLDHFHQEMQTILRTYLPEDFPKNLPKGELWGKSSTERISKVYPAMIPINRMIEAYGARLNWSKLGFKVSIKKTLKIDTNLDSLELDAKRAWIAAYFATPGSCISFANIISKKGSGDFNLIVEPDFTNKYLIPGHTMKTTRDTAGNIKSIQKEVFNSVKTGLVRAAEAKCLAELIPGLKLP